MTATLRSFVVVAVMVFMIACDRNNPPVGPIGPDPTPTPELRITTISLPQGTVSVEYSASLSAENGQPPYAWTATGLPVGLAVSGDAIKGVPEQSGTFSVNVTVNDAAGKSATVILSLTIVASPLRITTTALNNATRRQPYTAQLAAQDGEAPYTWSAAGLPQGLSVSANGAITGKPVMSGGNFSISVTVKDAKNSSATQSLNLFVISPPDLIDPVTGKASGVTVEILSFSPPVGSTVTLFAGGIPSYNYCTVDPTQNRCFFLEARVCNDRLELAHTGFFWGASTDQPISGSRANIYTLDVPPNECRSTNGNQFNTFSSDNLNYLLAITTKNVSELPIGWSQYWPRHATYLGYKVR